MSRIFIISLFISLFFFSASAQNFRSYDGRGNNLTNPEWGAVDAPMVIKSDLVYADGMAAPNGANRPNPRTISNMLFNQPTITPDVMHLSDYCWAFGQFIDHDITLTPPDEHEAMTINVPIGDPWFDTDSLGTAIIPFSRTEHLDATGTSTDNPRNVANVATSFIDGSAFYGENAGRSHWMRTYSWGELKVSDGDLLPWNTITGEFDSDIDPNAPFMADDVGLSPKIFIAGDVRANENPLLTSLHTLFAREHNRICKRLRAVHLNWRDERIYQEARKRTVALLNAITYEEWLPTMGVHLPTYQGYDATVNPGIQNAFTVAAFRMGHTLVSGNLLRMDNDGNEIPEGNLLLRDAFFNPMEVVKAGGIEPYLKGMGAQEQQSFDAKMLDDIRNFLFGQSGGMGLDLAALNINRGRERGLPDYNSVRAAYGLPKYTEFTQINSNTDITNTLETLYGDINDIDGWVGMLSEERMDNALFGELVMTILMDQFAAFRDGDRYYYENDPHLTADEKAEIKATRLYDVVMRNSSLTTMQEHLFEAMPHDQICTAAEPYADIEGGIRRDDGAVINGAEVEVFTPSAAAFTTQAATGDYIFADLETCERYELTPEKSGTAADGVSTLDIIKLSRHILNVELLDSPYKMLAADADGNQAISTLDIVGMRKVILRTATEFPSGKIWGFVPADHQFDMTDFWAVPAPDRASVLGFDDNTTVDFIGYKIGDVDNSLVLAQSIDDRTTATISLNAENVELKSGAFAKIPVSAKAAMNLAGMQFTLNSKCKDVEILGIEGIGLNFADQNYYLNEAGVMTFSWNGNANIAPGDVLFEVTVYASEEQTAQSALQISSQLAAATAFDKNLNQYNLDLDFGIEEASEEFIVFQNTPNPFTDETVIGFNLPEGSNVTLTVFDLSGKRVFENTGAFAAGYNTFEIDGTKFGQSGVYHYRLTSDFGNQTRKFVLVK